MGDPVSQGDRRLWLSSRPSGACRLQNRKETASKEPKDQEIQTAKKLKLTCQVHVTYEWQTWECHPRCGCPPATATAASIPSALLTRAACTTQDQANPIAADYADKTTGVFNATVAVLPIPLDTARGLIPAQYAILEHVYVSYFKSIGYSTFPKGYYPLIVQAGTEHDIQSPAGTTADVSQFGFEFPFVDRLGDNSTSFRYTPAQLASTDSGATFTPDCAAYAGVPNIQGQVATVFSVASGDASAQLSFHQTAQTPVPFSVFRNVTNQPGFTNDETCDLQVRLFTPSVFYPEAQFTPRSVAGSVVLDNAAPLVGLQSFGVSDSGVRGFQLATPYIETTGVDCATLSGYSGAKVRGY
ncbi:hypothetical protein F503_02123 [Ophiostoma piceae UAMH 11346]|uniref:Uncharacterized protein n=1 Tax=Ophiostoma piceae (strain UAMH 11346) TaxID=1262450 RepID=S3BVV7_OPHP1|nr:hypothetical protein F503_02123 [Ophiostoma piceae UAMH 11346]